MTSDELLKRLEARIDAMTHLPKAEDYVVYAQRSADIKLDKETIARIRELETSVKALEKALKDLSAWKAVIRSNLMRIDPSYDHTKFDTEWDEKIAFAHAAATVKGEV